MLLNTYLLDGNWLSNIDWQLIATVGIPALIVVIGWLFVHWLDDRRDLTNRKREARLKAMERAYLRLANSANRSELTEQMIDDIELFVWEIQLYGTPKQIKLMQEIVEGFKKPNNYVSYDPILRDLRDTLRKELELEAISDDVWWLRLNRKLKNTNRNERTSKQ